MTNLLVRAISTDDGDRAAKIIQNALGIESDEVADYCFPKSCPATVSNGRGSSEIGWERKPDIWLEDGKLLGVLRVCLNRGGRRFCGNSAWCLVKDR
jgi:hypothetical protein